MVRPVLLARCMNFVHLNQIGCLIVDFGVYSRRHCIHTNLQRGDFMSDKKCLHMRNIIDCKINVFGGVVTAGIFDFPVLTQQWVNRMNSINL